MITISPLDNIPDFTNLFNVTKNYIKEKQGAIGFIEIDPKESGCDYMYSVEYEHNENGSLTIVERLIRGIRVKDNDIEILTSPDSYTFYETFQESDFLDDENWTSLSYSDVYYIPTLINIAEVIEEYI